MISLFIAAIIFQSPGAVDFPWARGAFPGVLPGVDIVAVVEAVTEHPPETRQELVSAGPGLPPSVLGNSFWVRTAQVKALSGKGVKKGEDLRVVWPLFPGPAGPAAPPSRLRLNAGQRYLLFAFRPKSGRLTFPAFYIAGPSDSPATPFYAQLGGEGEVAAVMMFPTKEVSAPEDPSADDIDLSVVKTLDPSDDDGYRRVVAFLEHCGPAMARREVDGLPVEVQFTYTKPNRITDELKAGLKKASPYQQSKVWQLLLRWKLPGSVVGYVDSMKNLADDPSVYREGSGDAPVMDIWNYFRLEPPGPMRSEEWLDLVTTAKNDRVAELFMEGLGVGLDRGGQLRLAQKLLDPNPSIRRAAAYRLALVNGDRQHMPFLVYSPEKAAPIIQYWIDFYKVKQPR